MTYQFAFATDPTTRRAELRQAALALLSAPAYAVGQRVSVPTLGLANVAVVELMPSRTVGGETKFRVEWLEPAAGNAKRAANFFADELEAVR